MVMLRALVVFGLLIQVVAARAQNEQATPADAGKLAAADAPEATPSTPMPEFPLIVRIDDKALDPLRDKNVLHQGHVDRMVLGTRAIGTSWTRGDIDVQMLPNQQDASFTIHFRGTTQTKTIGYNDPARISSHTTTDFECARQVVFDPRIGLVAGPTVIKSRTELVFDGFSANRQLGRRLISRVAERRAREQHQQARAIAHRDNEAEIRRAFDERLNTQLALINRRLDIARYVNALFGPASKPRLASRSCRDCILIGIGNENSPQRLATDPPDRAKSAPIEIWVHNSLFGERMMGLAAIVERIQDRVLPAASQLQVLKLMLGPTQAADRQFDVGFQDGWVVIGLQNDVPVPVVVAFIMAADFAFRQPASAPLRVPVIVATTDEVTGQPQSAPGGR